MWQRSRMRLPTMRLSPFAESSLLPFPRGTSVSSCVRFSARVSAEEVVEAVRKGVEGNPLFLEERLTTLVETGAVFRDGRSWRLDPNVRGEVPEALERLMRSRVDRLGPRAHNAIVAASVLGVEFGLPALRAVTGLNDQLDGVVAELCAAGMLVEVPRQAERAYRFRHALMQEATYKGLLRAQRQQLHARVAWSVEDPPPIAWRKSAPFSATTTPPPGRIIARCTISEWPATMLPRYSRTKKRSPPFGRPYRSWRETHRAPTPLRWSCVARLAEVLWRTGRYDESREMFHEALNLVDPEESLLAARLHVRLGRMEINAHRYDPAVAAFDAAEALLGADPGGQDQERVDLWLELQLNGRAHLHYWRNEPALGMAVLEASRPVVETRGSLDQKKTFYDSLVVQQLRETRYRVDDEILVNERAALAAAEEFCGEHDLAWAFFMMGFCLLWRGELVEARERLEMALAGAERTGDVLLRTRALCYLNVAALRSHDADTVRRLAPEAMAAGEAAAYPEYVAVAKATLAWLAWQEDRLADVVRLGEEALQLWGTTIVSYSWYWPCLWPMIAVRLRSGQIAEAIDAARQLLAPPQQRLPDDLESLLQEAGAAWDQNENRVASDKLAAGAATGGDPRLRVRAGRAREARTQVQSDSRSSRKPKGGPAATTSPPVVPVQKVSRSHRPGLCRLLTMGCSTTLSLARCG